MLPLLFVTATFVGGETPPQPPPVKLIAPAVVERPVQQKPAEPGVTIALPNGSKVTTGAGDVELLKPITDQAAYDLRNCLQLQAAQPWMNWTCP